MSRPVRIDIEGGWYHVTARGHKKDGNLSKSVRLDEVNLNVMYNV